MALQFNIVVDMYGVKVWQAWYMSWEGNSAFRQIHRFTITSGVRTGFCLSYNKLKDPGVYKGKSKYADAIWTSTVWIVHPSEPAATYASCVWEADEYMRIHRIL